MLAGRIVKEQSDTARFNVDLTATSSLLSGYLPGEGGAAQWLKTETALAITTPTVVLGAGSWSLSPPPSVTPSDPSPVTVTAALVGGTALQLFITNGTPGNAYTVTTVVTDSANRKLTIEVGVQIAGQVTLAPAPVPNATLALPIGGGTLLGPLYLFEDPLTGKEAATRSYVDTVLKAGLFNSGIIVTNGATITSGGATITGNSKVTGTLETTGALTVDAGGATITGNSKVTGTLETTGALTVDAGGLTVTAGGAAVTGNSKITGTLETTGALTVDAGGLTVTAGGAAITGNSKITGNVETTGTLTVDAGGAQVTGNSKITGTLEVTSTLTADAGVNLGAPGLINVNSRVLMRGHINGLGTSRNAGTPNTKIDIALGAAMDEVAQAGFIIPSAILTIDAGTVGANGLDAGVLGVTTWYHVHVIGKPDGTAAGFLSNGLTPTLPSGYTLRRRIGSVLTDGASHFTAYTQNGDEFLWLTNFLDMNGVAIGLTAASRTLTVPFGIRVNALFHADAQSDTAGTLTQFASLDQNTATASSANWQLAVQTAANFAAGTFNVRTNAASQIRVTGSSNVATNAVSVSTYGWIDTRGRFA